MVSWVVQNKNCSYILTFSVLGDIKLLIENASIETLQPKHYKTMPAFERQDCVTQPSCFEAKDSYIFLRMKTISLNAHLDKALGVLKMVRKSASLASKKV